MNSVFLSISNQISKFRQQVLDLPTSSKFYYGGGLIGVLTIVLVERTIMHQALLQIPIAVLSLGFLIHLSEELNRKGSILFGVKEKYQRYKETELYKLCRLFFTILLGSIAYTLSQHLIAQTMSLPANWFFNSVAIATPFISFWLAIIFLLTVSMFIVLTLFVHFLWRTVIDYISLVSSPFVSIYGTIKSSFGNSDNVNLPPMPTGFKFSDIKVAPLIGASCLALMVTLPVDFLTAFATEGEHLKSRQAFIIQLDYYSQHHCAGQIGDGFHVLTVGDSTVSAAKIIKGEWVIQTLPCSYLQ